jgi:hypothetical protein
MPMRLADLDPGARRRALVRSGVTIVGALALLLAALYLLPFDHFSSGRSVLRLGAVIALVAAVFILQVRSISHAELPELRAVEALGIVIGVFLVGFSIIYLSMSNDNSHTFTQVLDPTKALYFTISVFSTVGFGDITPRTDPARLVVAVQMLLDLAIIGIVVRMIFTAARSRIAPREEAGGANRPAPAE